MASNSLGTILGLGIAGVAAWYLYEHFFTGSPAGSPAGGNPPSSPAGASSAPVFTPPPPPATVTITTRAGQTVTVANPGPAGITAASGSGSRGGADTGSRTTMTTRDLATSLLSAAQGNAYLQNGQMSAWDWEWILENGLGRPATPNVSTAFADPTALISPQQFVSTLGLSGLCGLGALAPAAMRHNPGGNYRFHPKAWPVTRMIA